MAGIFGCCPCILFKIKTELTWPKKNLKTLCRIQFLQIVLIHKIPKLGKHKLRSL